MPYRLSSYGASELLKKSKGLPSNLDTLTSMQRMAITYLAAHQDDSRYIGAAEVADYYKYPSGQYFRGVLASLYQHGLLNKKEM